MKVTVHAEDALLRLDFVRDLRPSTPVRLCAGSDVHPLPAFQDRPRGYLLVSARQGGTLFQATIPAWHKDSVDAGETWVEAGSLARLVDTWEQGDANYMLRVERATRDGSSNALTWARHDRRAHGEIEALRPIPHIHSHPWVRDIGPWVAGERHAYSGKRWTTGDFERLHGWSDTARQMIGHPDARVMRRASGEWVAPGAPDHPDVTLPVDNTRGDRRCPEIERVTIKARDLCDLAKHAERMCWTRGERLPDEPQQILCGSDGWSALFGFIGPYGNLTLSYVSVGQQLERVYH